MKTDWNLIREMMNTAIDSCEQIDAAGFDESLRSAVININGVEYTVMEFLISAWTMPENIRYKIIRDRHDTQTDSPYVPEAARILQAMAQACSELIGAGSLPSSQQAIAGMNHWFKSYAVPHIVAAVAQSRESKH
ncbi:hypothetical protein F3J44_25950 [Pantoea sp. Tr-811]|uniref:hypothetical protein n=1 Tax=unclassified Pantoea TaxID=2630326 RepID=UPI00141E2B64|nr:MULTISPECIES: hypothetical protein [unclassified Pantoea]NIE73196.1 hypothetical protein [Pantoea sp. Ap-967]NIF29796.1 hypothetical protein [Pantoea sp. Tr-811]